MAKTTQQRKREKSSPPSTTGSKRAVHGTSFRSLAWDAFDPAAVIKVLLSEEPTFPFHREVLLYALGAWVTAPGDDGMRKHAIRMAVRLRVADAERAVLERSESERPKCDARIRREEIGHDFISQIYYGIGGARELDESSTESYKKKFNKSYIKANDTFLRMLHLARHSFISKGTDVAPPGMDRYHKFIENVDRLHRKPGDAARRRKAGKKHYYKFLKQDTIEREYGKMPQATLAYAASLTRMDGEFSNRSLDGAETLLDRFLEPRLGAPENLHLILSRWLRHAAFVRDNILPMIPHEKFDLSLWSLDNSSSAATFVSQLNNKLLKPSKPSVSAAELDILRRFIPG
ncbi:hypothetical protein GI374_03065 [Paracoccus sp. S-4012]|uniref:hypothetical protein n=1 Tax=Paracoccus sp. S-4012 TaxID=2665648 RepID=UPI0012B10308|nr:hypothetical protein [Paracoccus sp. S-4012]MRX49442.1 hypothetical protein [Paracoccus sp. S-4012]